MITPESETLATDIERIIEDTKSGKIKWTKSNPTTFVWKTDVARLSLQRVTQTQIVQVAGPTGPRQLKTLKTYNYIFQAVELPNSIRLALNTTEENYASLRENLENLFVIISSTVDRQGLDFLKKLIGEH